MLQWHAGDEMLEGKTRDAGNVMQPQPCRLGALVEAGRERGGATMNENAEGSATGGVQGGGRQGVKRVVCRCRTWVHGKGP